MVAKFVKVDPFDLVVFGGTGDLAYRKLYPALYHRDKSEQFTDPTRIIAVSRREVEQDVFRASVREALIKFGEANGDAEALPRFLDRIDHLAVDATSEAGWKELQAMLGAEQRT